MPSLREPGSGAAQPTESAKNSGHYRTRGRLGEGAGRESGLPGREEVSARFVEVGCKNDGANLTVKNNFFLHGAFLY